MIAHVLLSLAVASGGPCDYSQCKCGPAVANPLSDGDITLINNLSGESPNILRVDRDLVPQLCSRIDARLPGLLIGLMNRIDADHGSEICCIPYAFAQIRLREPDRQKAAALLVLDINTACPKDAPWSQCHTNLLARSTRLGLQEIAFEGRAEVLRSILKSPGPARDAALSALYIFCPWSYGHVKAPEALRQLLPDLASLYSDSSAGAKALDLTTSLASNKAELLEYLNRFSREQPSPDAKTQRALERAHRHLSKLTE